MRQELSFNLNLLPFTSACLNATANCTYAKLDAKLVPDNDQNARIQARIKSQLDYQFQAFDISVVNSTISSNVAATLWKSSDINPKIVVCYGGGIDSTVLAFKLLDLGYRARDIQLLYIDYHGPWSVKEAKVANSLMPRLNRLFGFNTAYLDLYASPQFLVKNYIVPGRNAMLAELAKEIFQSTSQIVIASNFKQDDSAGARDKGRVFFGDMTDIFSMLHGPTQCWSPVLHRSKMQALLDLDSPEVLQMILQSTTSCYSFDSLACGHCYACFKRNLLLNTLRYVKKLDLVWDSIVMLDFTKDDLPEIYKEFLDREREKGRKFAPEIEDMLKTKLCS
jgi:7-cyano-7-deazaguanine synthase in queuosine biosynthesis